MAPAQTPPSPVVAAYAFDEDEGSTHGYATGGEHDGTIEGPAWTNRGKFGTALSFNERI